VRSWLHDGLDTYADPVTLHLVGYWRNDKHLEFPDPAESVDPDWDEADRDAVATYFLSGTFLRGFMGYSPCRICGEHNGASEYTDGLLVWPEGLSHYVEAHSVRPPEAVIQYALERMKALNEAPVTLEWWLAGSPPPIPPR
jgi:hypothetical protein